MSAPAQNFEHHDRLTRLEEGYGEVAAQMAANTVQLEGVQDRIHDGFERIHEHLDTIHSKLDAISTVQADHRDQLTKLESTHKTARSVLKWAAGIVATVIGAAILSYVGLK